MSANSEKLRQAFARSLSIDPSRVVDELTYNTVPEWDSVGHMALVADLETEFGLMLDTEDIIDMSSVAKAKTILAKHGVAFEAG